MEDTDKENVDKEDADKEGRRGIMEKPTKTMSVTWVLRGAATTMPRMTPARSSWRSWDPGRRKVYVVVIREVIVRINHDRCQYGITCACVGLVQSWFLVVYGLVSE